MSLDVLAVRVAFVALSFVGGAGVAVYIGAWLVLPPENAGPGQPGAVGQGTPQTGQPIYVAAIADRHTVRLVAAVASGIAALLIAVAVLGDPAPVGAVSPGVVALAGLVAVWRHAGPEDRLAGRRLGGLITSEGPGSVPTKRRLLVAGARTLVGAALVAICTSSLLAPKHLNSADITAALSALGVVGGFALVLAPWWLRLGRELVAERRHRARAEEKAEMAAHLHDSVLQTLALIQRSAADPQQVQRLARAQERELRSWLFDQPLKKGARSAPDAAEASLAAALGAVQEEVEDVHGIRVELVTVGDSPMDEAMSALVAAAREAVVNAAKWSGAEVVSVYAEADEEEVSVFVRDKGRGFDPKNVAPDRRGISESIHNRMHRNGGTSSLSSAPGKGTEVVLKMASNAERLRRRPT